ncbi:MAG: hypothetical protein MJ059_02000 [Lachnospiraceae bacterium]|nr:hypothetical protein [Lachnospiraceae bacterium]
MLESVGRHIIENAKENGATDAQAYAQGIAQGAAEGIFETLSLSKIKGLAVDDDFVAKNAKEFIIAMEKQMVGEGSEEFFTDIANDVSDAIIMKDKSQWQQLVNANIAAGMSEEKAKAAAVLDLTKQAAVSFLGGAVSGAFFGAGAQVANKSRVTSNLYTDLVEDYKSGNADAAIDSKYDALSSNQKEQALNDAIDALENERVNSESKNIPESEPVKAGKVTQIKNPYEGIMPVESKSIRDRFELNPKSVNDASQEINSAEAASVNGVKSFKGFLKEKYKELFNKNGGDRVVRVEGVSFEDGPYDVALNQTLVKKVINDKNLSAEKLAVIEQLDDIVEDAEYVGSGSYVQHGSKNKDTVRFDYFERGISIDGRPYVVAFDVEVFPSTNNYRTHKVVREISLTDEFTTDMAPEATAMNYTTSADVAPEATAKEVRSDFTDIIIPGQEKVKLSGKDNKGSDAKRLDASGLNENQTKLLEAIRANDTVTAEDLMDRMPADEVDEVVTYGDKNGSPENASNTYETSGNNNQAEVRV